MIKIIMKRQDFSPSRVLELFFILFFWEKVFLRSSLQEMFYKEGVLRVRSATLLKKRPWQRCFPVNFAKFLRAPFLTEHFRWLLRLLHFLSSSLRYLFIQEKVQTNIKGKTLRSSHSQMFFKIAVLKNFSVTVKKTPVLECLFDKFAGLQACIFTKRRLRHWCFLKKFLRTAFLVEHLTVHYTFSKFYVLIKFFGRLCVHN